MKVYLRSASSLLRLKAKLKISERGNVENDKIIEHALQKELSRHADDEAVGLSHEILASIEILVDGLTLRSPENRRCR